MPSQSESAATTARPQRQLHAPYQHQHPQHRLLRSSHRTPPTSAQKTTGTSLHNPVTHIRDLLRHKYYTASSLSTSVGASSTSINNTTIATRNQILLQQQQQKKQIQRRSALTERSENSDSEATGVGLVGRGRSGGGGAGFKQQARVHLREGRNAGGVGGGLHDIHCIARKRNGGMGGLVVVEQGRKRLRNGGVGRTVAMDQHSTVYEQGEDSHTLDQSEIEDDVDDGMNRRSSSPCVSLAFEVILPAESADDDEDEEVEIELKRGIKAVEDVSLNSSISNVKSNNTISRSVSAATFSTTPHSHSKTIPTTIPPLPPQTIATPPSKSPSTLLTQYLTEKSKMLSDYSCPICLEVFCADDGILPVTLECCSNSVCQGCCEMMVETSPNSNCPICRSRILTSLRRKAGHLTNELLLREASVVARLVKLRDEAEQSARKKEKDEEDKQRRRRSQRGADGEGAAQQQQTETLGAQHRRRSLRMRDGGRGSSSVDESVEVKQRTIRSFAYPSLGSTPGLTVNGNVDSLSSRNGRDGVGNEKDEKGVQRVLRSSTYCPTESASVLTVDGGGDRITTRRGCGGVADAKDGGLVEDNEVTHRVLRSSSHHHHQSTAFVDGVDKLLRGGRDGDKVSRISRRAGAQTRQQKDFGAWVLGNDDEGVTLRRETRRCRTESCSSPGPSSSSSSSSSPSPSHLPLSSNPSSSDRVPQQQQRHHATNTNTSTTSIKISSSPPHRLRSSRVRLVPCVAEGDVDTEEEDEDEEESESESESEISFDDPPSFNLGMRLRPVPRLSTTENPTRTTRTRRPAQRDVV